MSSASRGLLSASVPHQEASTGTLTSGFTAVNGRISPPQDGQVNGTTESGGQYNDMPRSQSANSWQQVEARNGGRPGATVILDVTPPRRHRNPASATSPGKRKRHESDEDSDDSSSPHTPPDHSPKKRAVKPFPPGPPLSLQGLPGQGSSRERQNYPPSNTRDQYDSWHDERNEDSHETRLVAALQHDMGLEHQTNGEDVADGATATPKSTVMVTAAGVQVDTSRRKRVFSNRTKTGCLTCRRRKKKCDETKPECNNCLRGGFGCEGYAPKTYLSKPYQQETQARLLACDTGGLRPRPPPHTDLTDPQSVAEGARSQPIIVVDERRHSEVQNGWSDSPWGQPTHRTYASDRHSGNDHDHGPHAVDVANQRRVLQRPEPSHIVHRMQSQGSHTSISHRVSNSPTVTAQLALQHQPAAMRSSHSVLPPPQATEKEMMLRGEPYRPFDEEIAVERELCKAALWRFNSAVAYGTPGISPRERTNLLRAVLEPPTIQRPSGSLNNCLGRDVSVDAPFTCLYGYNITIGDEVVIGPNCTILDPCAVIVGPRCIFEADVKICGNTRDENDIEGRSGSRGRAVGRQITIESDVFIGMNVTISPSEGDLVIGAGSTITAGSVVNTSVPKSVVFGGNPASVLRGIWGKSR